MVDDEKAFLSSLAEGLKDAVCGFEILTAENGKKALDAFRSGQRIDLLVTDLRMPEMNGFELLPVVKENYPGTRVIVLTSYTTPEIEEQLKSIGNCVCIEKPVEFEQLRDRIFVELALPPANGNKFSLEDELERLEFLLLPETYPAP